MKTYLLPEVVLEAILAYLLGRPMAEVEQGVAALRSLEEAPLPVSRRELENHPNKSLSEVGGDDG